MTDANPPDHAEAQDRGAASNVAQMALLMAADAALSAGLAAQRIDGGRFAVMHVGICVASAAWSCAVGGGTPRSLLAPMVQAAAWTLMAGPLGTLVATALLVPRRAKGTVETAIAQAPDRAEAVHAMLLDRRARIAGAADIAPMADAFAGGTQEDRFHALRLISRRYGPDMASTLRQAMRDPDGAVRVLASTVMAKLQNNHTRRLGALKATAGDEAAPTATGAAGAAAWTALARARLDYAESGLLEPSRAATETEGALACAMTACALAPDDLRAVTLLVEIKMRLIEDMLPAGSHEEAVAEGVERDGRHG